MVYILAVTGVATEVSLDCSEETFSLFKRRAKLGNIEEGCGASIKGL